MSFNPCDFCGCVPGNVSNDLFKQGVLNLLCSISEGGPGGVGTYYDVQVLCDPTTQARVLVRYAYENDGTVLGITAYNLDGTSYVGVISNLVDCATFAEAAFTYNEDSAHVSGNPGAFVLAVRNTALANFTSTDGDYSAFAVNIRGAAFVDVNASAQQSNPLGLLKLEDSAHASGDAGVAVLNYLHDTPQTAIVDASGDYGLFKGNTTGAQYVNIDFRSQVNTANGLLKLEDSVAGDGDAGVPTLLFANDTPQTAIAGSGDYTWHKGNTTGAQYVNIDFRSQVQTANGLLKSEDAAAGDGDAGVPAFGVRNDANVSRTGTDGDYGSFSLTASGQIKVVPGTDTVGGATPYSLVSLASTNATVVKNTPGQVYGIEVFNTNAAARYLKLYNQTGTPNPAADTPVKRITIPGNTAGSGAVMMFSVGVTFTAGIAFVLVTGSADTDNTGVAAGEIMVNIDYK